MIKSQDLSDGVIPPVPDLGRGAKCHPNGEAIHQRHASKEVFPLHPIQNHMPTSLRILQEHRGVHGNGIVHLRRADIERSKIEPERRRGIHCHSDRNLLRERSASLRDRGDPARENRNIHLAGGGVDRERGPR